MKKLIAYCKRLPQQAMRPWYPYLLGLIAFADYFLFVIPLDAMVVASLVAARKRWLSISFWSCLGSSIGALFFAILIQHFGVSFLETWAPHILQDRLAVLFTEWLQRYGFWALVAISIGPIHQHPTVAIAALAKMPLTVIFFSLLVGRFVKYCIYTWLSSHAKKYLDKLFKTQDLESMETDPLLVHRIAEIRSRMIQACERIGRDPQTVKLLLASKTVDPFTIREAFHAGALLFGENKVQEMLEKLPKLGDLPIEWHFIGRLQSNKVKTLLPHPYLIHSLDRLSLAEELQKQAEKADLTVKVLVEVNSSGEESKGGISPEKLPEFMEGLRKFDRLEVHGLMTIAVDGHEAQVRECFRKTKMLLDQVQPMLKGSELSMGMSGDFEWAIEEGATLIRVGSSVFGVRG